MSPYRSSTPTAPPGRRRDHQGLQGVRHLPGGEPRRGGGRGAGVPRGGGGVLRDAGGGEAAVPLRRPEQALPRVLEHPLRPERGPLLDGLPQDHLPPRHRRARPRVAGQAGKLQELPLGVLRRGARAFTDAAPAHRGGARPRRRILRRRPQRRQHPNERQLLPAVPGPEPDAGPPPALRPAPPDRALSGRRRRAAGEARRAVAPRPPRPRRLRGQPGPPDGDHHQRAPGQRGTPRRHEHRRGEAVGGDPHHAQDGVPHRAGAGDGERVDGTREVQGVRVQRVHEGLQRRRCQQRGCAPLLQDPHHRHR